MKQLVMFVLLFFVANNAYGDNNRQRYMEQFDSVHQMMENMEPPLHTIYLEHEARTTTRSNDFGLNIREYRPSWTNYTFRPGRTELTIGFGKDLDENQAFWTWRFW